MIWISADVILIRTRMIQATGGIDCLHDRAGLEAVILTPLQSFAGEDFYPSDLAKIARIGYGLASNHAFIDGNKRIGAMMTQLLPIIHRSGQLHDLHDGKDDDFPAESHGFIPWCLTPGYEASLY